ncbi:zinc-dependent alcohol dehydrogenase family protein [Pseudomarimonas salicorniae]|uniref:NAD(P)-dependent alcohol dehydrogenase n=1 Tax=Pseudomarimonas salicorniae TaxID=2933270 RepID=A0ABT0GHJ1_9GAMM|nr:NAD(P)-dependent alcohol dehydrogenase [Lysobacter sp. CAU 1642]MCK7593490.1 NAD(P)-dependent alcohol dehydrogenase [Lysobacter sp. CAU 1642]
MPAAQPAPLDSAPALPAALHWRARRGAGPDGLVASPLVQAPLAADAVRVRVLAVSLNHRDLMLLDGRAGPADRPVVPCSDAVGEVLEVGSAVRDLVPGQRVISAFFPDWERGPASAAATARALGGSLDGVLGDEVCHPAAAWVPLPDGVAVDAASTLSCAGVTAWHALHAPVALPRGAGIVVLGTGGVAIWALQLGVALGLRVAVVSSHASKLERAAALGASLCVDRRTHPRWSEMIQREWGGADRVLDVVGPATLAQSIEALRYGGSVAVVGRLSGSEPAAIDPAALFLEHKRLLGLMVGSRAMTAQLAAFVSDQRLHPVIEKVYPRGAVGEAFGALARADHVGKLVIRLDEAAV